MEAFNKQIDYSFFDFALSDENNNDIAVFENGHIKTKNFNSSEDATNEHRGLMSSEDKKELINNSSKLLTIQEGAEANDVNTEDSNIADFLISDENNNDIAVFNGGHIRTKNFDSSKDAPLTEGNIESSDFSIEDNLGNIILLLKKGGVLTKNFNSTDVINRIEELERAEQAILEWRDKGSNMPKTEENPLAKIRYDAGMCRIFRNWGFIGDSLNSGETYGRHVSYMSVVEEENKSISNEGIVDDNTSIITDSKNITGYQPSIKIIFNSNQGLFDKIIVTKIENGNYTPMLVGDNKDTYTLSITSGTVIVISYPKTNKPTIIFQTVTVSDIYDISWGQQICRLIGAAGYNFSVGGEYCKRWCIGTDNNRRWEKAQTDLKDVYTIALGVNDRGYWMANNTTVVDYPCVTAYLNQSDYGNLELTEQEVLADVNDSDYTQNANSYAGWYAGIIQRVKSVRKDSHIFCITNPVSYHNEWNQVIRILVNHFNEYYNKQTIWLVDLEAYNTAENLQWFGQNCYLNGHLSAFGYLYSAYQISTYIDWIIRHNVQAFKGSALIGSGNVADNYDTFLIN